MFLLQLVLLPDKTSFFILYPIPQTLNLQPFASAASFHKNSELLENKLYIQYAFQGL